MSDGHGGFSTAQVTVNVYQQPVPPQVLPHVTPPPTRLPQFTPFLNLQGAALDTVQGIGGPIGIMTPNGTGTASAVTGHIVGQVLGSSHLIELARLDTRLENYAPIDRAGLSGSSLHFALDGTTETAAGGGQLAGG